MNILGWLCAVMLSASDLPQARGLLDGVIARLPREPLLIEGELVAGKTALRPAARYKVDMFLDFGGAPSVVCYTIRDPSGQTMERLTVVRRPGKAEQVTYECGKPPAPAELPDIFTPVRETDFTWGDLVLCFLWWREGVTVGAEEVRGRPCFVVNVTPDAPSGRYKSVWVWIDQKFSMILQARGYDADYNAVRELSVESLKKVDERWMVKDIVVRTLASESRTRLRVLNVRHVNIPDSIEAIEAGERPDSQP